MSAKDDELQRLSEALKMKEEAMGQAMKGEKEELQKTTEQAQGSLLATKDTNSNNKRSIVISL